MRGGVGEGSRDKLLFLLGTALSWFTRADSLRDEINRVAQTYTPSLTPAEVTTYTRPILHRAIQAAEGRTVAFNGQERDARYAFKTDTLREWLGDLITPELETRLRVLLPADKLAEREKTRQKSRNRAQEGRYKQTRAAYLAKSQDRRSEALKLREQGLSVRAIAAQLGMGKSQVANLLSDCPKSAPPV